MPGFIGALDRNARYFWSVMPNVWLVDTQHSASTLSDQLRPNISTQDTLLVLQAGPDYNGYLPQPVWDWLDAEQRSGGFYGPR